MGLCVLYYVEYSLYNVKKVGFFYLGWNYTLSKLKDCKYSVFSKPLDSVRDILMIEIVSMNFILIRSLLKWLKMYIIRRAFPVN